MLGIKRTKSIKTLGLSIRIIEAIPRYRGLQGSIVTVLIRRPYIPGTFDRVLRSLIINVENKRRKIRVKNIAIYKVIYNKCLSA
jgi:hypothetical protein